ncbi:MAG: hypothetical protein ABSH36_00100, partial [Solirubrobacteraceae bacterium]
RLPVRRKAVTFVVGMKCHDGLVLCADTLESDGVTKTYHTKLSQFLWNDGVEDWGLCWGASGSSYTCDKFKDKMKQAFKKQKYNRAAIEEMPEGAIAVADAMEVVSRSRPFEDFADLAAIAVPTVVVASRDEVDPGHPLALAERYRQAIPGATLAVEDGGPPLRSPLAWQGGQLSKVLVELLGRAGGE